jgi:DNA-binding NtrC family response regulator
MPDDTTVPSLPVDPSATGGVETDLHCVVLAACPGHPRRVGESCTFSDLHLEYVFGRGLGDGRELRVDVVPWRPGFPGAPVPFDDASLSRRLLQFVPRPFGFEVEKRAKCTLHLAGVATEESGSVVFGETIQIDERFLFYVTRRPARLDLHYFPLGMRGPFGQADQLKIIGESYALYRALESLAFAAQTLEHVLLHGETGSGKELFARALHALSTRALLPFIARNAAAIPGPLLESELCGNIAGYPQATMPARIGMFAAADGGMMFLDEIGEMVHELQALLLRVLDAGGEYWRLGESKARRSDFRMVCATNRRLDELKVDFLPRLKRVVELPPLRDRREDIPLILRALAEKHVGALKEEQRKRFTEKRPDGTEQVRIGLDLVDALMVSDLPTNVRRLDTIVLDSIQHSKGRTLRAYPALRDATVRHARRNQRSWAGPNGRVRELTEGDVAVLRGYVGNGHGGISRAAKALGLSRYQVKRLIERYGIKAPDEPEPDEGE